MIGKGPALGLKETFLLSVSAPTAAQNPELLSLSKNETRAEGGGRGLGSVPQRMWGCGAFPARVGGMRTTQQRPTALRAAKHPGSVSACHSVG